MCWKSYIVLNRAHLGIHEQGIRDSSTTWSLLSLLSFVGFLPRNYVTNKWIVPPLHLSQGGSKPPCPASLFQTMRKDSYWPDLGHVLQSVLLDVFTHISSLQ